MGLELSVKTRFRQFKILPEKRSSIKVFKIKNMEYMPERHDPHLTYIYYIYSKPEFNCVYRAFLELPSPDMLGQKQEDHNFLVSFMDQMKYTVPDIKNTIRPKIKITIMTIRILYFRIFHLKRRLKNQFIH